MGTWGAGNLQNDTALDEVGIRSNKLAETIWARLQKRTSWEADEWEHAALFVDLETLLALHSVGLFSASSLRGWSDLDSVLQRWMKGWENYFPQLGGSQEFVAERRAVIEGTFSKVRALATRK